MHEFILKMMHDLRVKISQLQLVNKMCSHCLFLVVYKSETSSLLQDDNTQTLNIVSCIRNKLLRTVCNKQCEPEHILTSASQQPCYNLFADL